MLLTMLTGNAVCQPTDGAVPGQSCLEGKKLVQLLLRNIRERHTSSATGRIASRRESPGQSMSYSTGLPSEGRLRILNQRNAIPQPLSESPSS